MRQIRSLLLPIGSFSIPFLAGVAHSKFRLPHYKFGSQNSMVAYAAFGLLQLVSSHVAGIPDEIRGRQRVFIISLTASAFGTGVWAAIQTVFPRILPRQVIFVTGAAMLLLNMLCTYLHVRATEKQLLGERVIAVLNPHEAANFSADVGREFPLPEIRFSLVSLLEDTDIVGTEEGELRDLVEVDSPTTIVLSDSASSLPQIVDAATLLHRRGVKIRSVASFYNDFFGKVALHDINRMAMLFDIQTVHNAPYRRLKRIVDFLGALFGILLCALIIPFVVVGNMFGNRGRLFFSQTRVGERGNLFTMYKFRTMKPMTSEGKGYETATWTSPDDPRVTRFGRTLRVTHLDELPQFWNILRGELSLVGPRPEQPHYVEELTAKESAFELRHLVRPGLTGWAQVKFRYAASEAAAIEKLQYDLYYVQHQSLSLDLAILTRTAASILRRRGQ